MPRYEFREGSSSKFWEIERSKDEKTFVVTWGKIGTAGQSQKKKFKQTWQAAREFEKLVKEKIGKGYQLADGSGKPAKNGKNGAKSEPVAAPTGKVATNPQLEAAVLDDPSDKQSWLVYSDWLQQAGDPRGELIALKSAKSPKASKHVAKHAALLWGNAKKYTEKKPFGQWTPSWRPNEPQDSSMDVKLAMSPLGFIDSITLIGLDEEGRAAGAMTALLSCPLGRFVREVHLDLHDTAQGSTGQPDYTAVIAAMARVKPAGLRKLKMETGGWQISWSMTGNLGKLFAETPRLEEIDIEMGGIDLGKRLDLPKLKSLRIETGGIGNGAKTIGAADWPALETLILYLGAEDYGGIMKVKEIEGITGRPQAFPKLRHLALCNSQIQGKAAEAITKSKLLKQLQTLDLSKGTLNDADAEVIVKNAAAFKHLKTLDLSESYLSPAMEKTIKAAIKGAVTKDQRFDELEDDPDYDGRYTVVGE